MTPGASSPSESCRLSIGIFAWNEERSIASTLESLFQQSLFEELSRRKLTCEIVCVTNGCTDRTPKIAEQIFARQKDWHPFAGIFEGRVAAIPRPGKVNAWNQYVHSFSTRSASYLFMMDADILIHREDTLLNMLKALETDPEASIAVDCPRKHIRFKRRKSLSDHLALTASRMTLEAGAQLCGQLYCIRAEVARSICMPRDLAACEDGLLKALVCTDNLSHAVWPKRIRVADRAEHTFEAYTRAGAILKNQKRQIIGQTMVHILVDKVLPALSDVERQHLAETIKQKDLSEPEWLKEAVAKHLQQTRPFWKLYPGLLTVRFRRLKGRDRTRQLTGFPAALAASAAALLASFLAYRALKSGALAYWPKARRQGFEGVKPEASDGPFRRVGLCAADGSKRD
jgi:Glycosyl transferase family 2